MSNKLLQIQSLVTYFAPIGAPAVANKPVVLTVLGTIADNYDCMVQIGFAARRINIDTALVVSKTPLRSINSNGHWTVPGNSLLQRLFISVRHISVAAYSNTIAKVALFAYAFLSSVLIVGGWR